MSKKTTNSELSNKYLNRPIRESEDELLKQIWNSFDSSLECSEEELEKNYQEVRSRIAKRKKVFWLYVSSIGTVAAMALFFFLFQHTSPIEENIPIHAQLNNLGVNVSQEQVVLMVGDSAISNLGTTSKIKSGKGANIEMQSATGEAIKLQKSTTLKIYVPTGKNFNLELSDGTKVVLNAETLFEYPSSFESQEERRVKIKGEGFFEVASNKTKPFFVEMPNGESIRVLGTSFNVSSYDENLENITTIASGEVAYHLPGNDYTINLVKNQQISVDKQSSKITKKVVDAREYSLWQEGIIYFNKESLGNIALKLSRMYGIEIKVSKQYYNTSFSGMIRYERGIDYITNLITTTSNIKCIIENGTIYLK